MWLTDTAGVWGIRSIEFRGKDGFWLNGRPYPNPLIGANRHQDFAVVGNALSNSLHWRDAKKLRDAGLRVIRNAHYPQDPAFMDACDELGLFVIVNTPQPCLSMDVGTYFERDLVSGRFCSPCAGNPARRVSVSLLLCRL